ncbi:MAG: hypothetical protein HQL91_13185 [Magnetococcales bacterium]|nr:hypothetical protein [Magnetococcales bacterium]
MDLKLFAADLTHLDHHSLERIATIAAQARRSLLIGIASIRGTDDTLQPESASSETDLMVAQLGRLTLMWDEIHHRASRLLSDELLQVEEWPTEIQFKSPSITLH